jgi:hypothetical protein
MMIRLFESGRGVSKHRFPAIVSFKGARDSNPNPNPNPNPQQPKRRHNPKIQ